MTDKSVHISVSEASKKFGITRAYIYTLIKQGRLATNTDDKGNTLIFVEEIKAVAKKKKKRTTKVKEENSIGVVKGYVKPNRTQEPNDMQILGSLIGVAIMGGVIGYIIANLLR
jgi:predicted DNA-binding transcriptional regulator AlpA